LQTQANATCMTKLLVKSILQVKLRSSWFHWLLQKNYLTDLSTKWHKLGIMFKHMEVVGVQFVTAVCKRSNSW